jgi:hypothetical protein
MKERRTILEIGPNLMWVLMIFLVVLAGLVAVLGVKGF